MSSFEDITKAIRKLANPEKGVFLQRFFKTGKGQYGEGDVFLGLTVPQSRIIAKQFEKLSLTSVTKLLRSKAHEDRLIALIILTMQYKKGTEAEKETMYELYLANTEYINNWDLVDLSAEYIVGEHLLQAQKGAEPHAEPRSRHSGEHGESGISIVSTHIRDSGKVVAFQNDGLVMLTNLAQSPSLWERRIAIISTFAWIKKGESDTTLLIADLLLHDTEDLMHKAVGWMLREVGKRVSQDQEEAFLKTRYKTMPRTMLRYAIERFPEEKRKKYLLGEI